MLIMWKQLQVMLIGKNVLPDPNQVLKMFTPAGATNCHPRSHVHSTFCCSFSQQMYLVSRIFIVEPVGISICFEQMKVFYHGGLSSLPALFLWRLWMLYEEYALRPYIWGNDSLWISILKRRGFCQWSFPQVKSLEDKKWFRNKQVILDLLCRKRKFLQLQLYLITPRAWSMFSLPKGAHQR